MRARRILLWTLLVALGSRNLWANPDAVAAAEVRFLNLRLYVEGPVPWLGAVDMNRDGLPDLVVQNGRGLEVYLQDARLGIDPTPRAKLAFPDRDFVFDVGARATGEETGVIAIHPGGVEWFAYRDAGFAAPAPVLEFTTLFRGSCTRHPVRAPLLFDMEGDGDADLVLPHADGLLIFAATPDGYALSQQLRADVDVLVTPEGRSIQDRMQTVLTVPSFYFGDVNGDRRLDLLVEGHYEFDIYTQDTAGCYDAAPSMTVSVNAIGSKKRSGRRFFTYEVPPKVADLNRDGTVDAIATFPSKGVTALFLGKAGQRVFETPDQVIRFDGWTLAHIVQDVDGDGRLDLILAKMEKVGFWGGLQILITKTIDVDIVAYLNQTDGRYPESPDYTRRIEVPLILSASHQMLKVETPYLLNFAGDYNRDGRRDMLFKSGTDRLSVHFGAPKGVFTEEVDLEIATIDTTAFASSQPTVSDLNGDGVSDLVLYHRDFDGKQHLLEVLLSRIGK